MRRCSRRVLDLNIDDDPMILSEILRHSSGGKSHKHLSTPRVRIRVVPATSVLKREGNKSLLLSSIELWYSPINIFLPLSPIFSHFYPPLYYILSHKKMMSTEIFYIKEKSKRCRYCILYMH